MGGLLRELKMTRHVEAITSTLLIMLFLASVVGMWILITNVVLWFLAIMLTAPLWTQIVVPLALLILFYNRIYNELG